MKTSLRTMTVLITSGTLLFPSVATADQVINDDLVTKGSLCVGVDCVNGESFGFDTIRLKENNVRIRFVDTSSTASFPTTDWQLTANDSAPGGQNRFSIEDVDSGVIPFTVEATAPSNSVYIDSTGRVGFGTANPVTEMHTLDGDTPTLRLEQDGSSGFTSQIWDVAGNETNFFIRDAATSSLPFRIMAGAPSTAFSIASDGDIGLGDTTPDAGLDVVSTNPVTAKLENPIGAVKLEMTDNQQATVTLGALAGGMTLTADGFTLESISPTAAANCKGDDAQCDDPGHADEQACIDAGAEWLPAADTYTTQGDCEDAGGTWITAFDTSFSVDAVTGDLTVGGAVHAQAFEVTSSRASKENIAPVHPMAILSQIKSLGVYTWSYIRDRESTPHMGPMAEEFFETFGLGKTDKRISLPDVTGVLLAAVQGLFQWLEAQGEALTALEAENLRLLQQNEDLERRVTRLERLISAKN
ncbi:MAG: tail fiber domain-containing protein [Myxococcota bacterium]